jgi:hypothetical protein
MTFKTGDAVSLPIYLESNAGAAQTYANQAAFIAATWTLTWYQAGVALASQPTYTVTPLGSTGIHFIGFTLPYGVDTIVVGAPSGFRSDPAAMVIVTPTGDTDSILSALATASGTPINNGAQTTYAFFVPEGDSFIKALTVPASALTDFGLSDFSTGTWIVTAAGRDPGDTTTNPPAFVMTGAIVSAAARTVTIGWGSIFPTGAMLTASDIANGSKTWKFDAQFRTTLVNAITAVTSGANGTFRMAGDVRKLFDVGGTFTVSGSTGNDATYTVTAIALVSGNTILTVANVPSGVADGSVNAILTISPISGTITVTAQVDRT